MKRVPVSWSHRSPSPRLGLAGALGAACAGLASVLLIVSLLHSTPGPEPSLDLHGRSAATRPTAPTGAIATPNAPGFQAPPPNAVVFAREDGSDAVALAVATRGQGMTLRASLVGPDGRGIAGERIMFVVKSGGRSLRVASTECGRGCYRADVPTVGRAVGVRRGGRSLFFSLPHPWPPPPAQALVARAARVWRGLHTLVARERLASSSRNSVHTVYRMVAPNRLSYQIAGGGPAAVIIGTRRWDRTSSSKPWQRSSQQPALRQPAPYWQSVRDAHVVARLAYRGKQARQVTFFDPSFPAWFEIVLDSATLRTLDLRMVATAHFMHEVYGPFNSRFTLKAPR